MSFMVYGSLDCEMINLMASTRLFRSSSLILIIFLQFLFNNLCCPFFLYVVHSASGDIIFIGESRYGMHASLNIAQHLLNCFDS